MELYNCCNGQWNIYVEERLLNAEELGKFLEYSALFLSNVGNYYVSPLFDTIEILRADHFSGLWRPEIHARR